MPRVSYNTIIEYLDFLASNHVNIADSYRWNVSDISGAFRKGVALPVMLIDPIENHPQGDAVKIINDNMTAITILGKPNTTTAQLDSYSQQNIVLNYTYELCLDVMKRILSDAQKITINGSKNWMYGMVDVSSFHILNIGPVFTDRLYGYRMEIVFKNTESLIVDESKWNDLPA
jgi:hypothetical protein